MSLHGLGYDSLERTLLVGSGDLVSRLIINRNNWGGYMASRGYKCTYTVPLTSQVFKLFSALHGFLSKLPAANSRFCCHSFSWKS